MRVTGASLPAQPVDVNVSPRAVGACQFPKSAPTNTANGNLHWVIDQ